MAAVSLAKVVSALPGTLTPSTLYAVRVGVGFDLYLSDSTGNVAHKINNGAGGSDTIFIGDSPTPSTSTYKLWITSDLSVYASIDGGWAQIGGDGVDGREVELQVSSNLLQWRYVGGPSWITLFNLSTLGGGGSPSGTSGQVQYNNAGSFGGAANVQIGAAGNLILGALTAQPAAPPADTIQVYGRTRAGATFLDVQRPSGRDFPLQPHLGVNRVGTWAPSTGTTVVVNGIPRSSVGTVSTPALAATSLSTSMRRWRVTSAATANAAADERSALTVCWRGNAAGRGGWTYVNRISLAVLPALSRAFFGILASTAALSTTQDPGALTNCIGIGFVQGTDTNWQVIRNDASGAAVKTDMGASFPVSSLTNVYTLYIACPPNGNSIWVRVVEEESGEVFEQEFTTDIPASTTFLSVRNYMNNGGTAAACAYECSGVYIETDY